MFAASATAAWTARAAKLDKTEPGWDAAALARVAG
jgi:hypothetical protein